MSYESAKHTQLTREYLTEDLEDQIMFNLIRAKHGLPFVHYDISTIQSQVGQNFTPGINGSRSAATSGFRDGFSPEAALRTITRGVSPSLTANRNANQTINASPVYSEPKIYAAYVTFLNTGIAKPKSEPKKPSRPATKVTVRDSSVTVPRIDSSELKTKPDGSSDGTTVKVTPSVTTTSNESEYSYELTPPADSLDLVIRGFGGEIVSVVETKQKPHRDLYVRNTLKRWQGSYYYVPIKYIAAFSKLCIATTARGDLGGSDGTMAPSISGKISPVERTLQQLQIDTTNQLNLIRGER